MTTHEELQDQLNEIGSMASASELHGHYCGRLIAGHQLRGDFGLKITSECIGLSTRELTPFKEFFADLTDQTVAVLENDLFSFQLLLPSDEIALPSRLEALSDWCQGFLAGIASTAGLQDSAVMREEADTVNDIIEISKISLDVDESEESETLFSEVSEYVRLAVFNLFDQFRIEDGEAVSTGVEPTTH